MENWAGWADGCWLGWGENAPPTPPQGGGQRYYITPPKKIVYDSDEEFIMAWMMFMQSPYKLEK